MPIFSRSGADFFTVYADFSPFVRDINGEKKNISLLTVSFSRFVFHGLPPLSILRSVCVCVCVLSYDLVGVHPREGRGARRRWTRKEEDDEGGRGEREGRRERDKEDEEKDGG